MLVADENKLFKCFCALHCKTENRSQVVILVGVMEKVAVGGITINPTKTLVGGRIDRNSHHPSLFSIAHIMEKFAIIFLDIRRVKSYQNDHLSSAI